MTDLDLPLLPSADQIRRREFATVRRGYDPDQVRDYLKQVASQLETLEKELRQERMGVSATVESDESHAPVVAGSPAAPLVDPYAQAGERVASVLKAADEEAAAMVASAKETADRLVAEARAEADRVRLDARAKAEELRASSAAEVERAREEADKVLGGLEERRETLVTQMHEMQSKLLSVAKDLEAAEEAITPLEVEKAPPPPPFKTATDGPSTSAQSETPKEQGEDTREKRPSIGDDIVDPRYEDLWAAPSNTKIDVPDLSSIDIDFEEE
jgi:cell division initiation protein